jgi:hypothetical protein
VNSAIKKENAKEREKRREGGEGSRKLDISTHR